jgi:hypothetical protein
MRIKELLTETPLPDDWDRDIYNERIPFAQRIRYAKERAEQLGVGSARVAFKIPYQGRDTVLKIAKNRKGAAQNNAEISFLGDYYIRNLGIVIPMIDYDEENVYPTWIHTEYARRIKPTEMRRFTDGLDIKRFVEVAAYAAGVTYPYDGDHSKFLKYYTDEEKALYHKYQVEDNTLPPLFAALVNLIGNYQGSITWQDFTILRNWGMYQNSPVIVDIGLSEEVRSQHYS